MHPIIGLVGPSGSGKTTLIKRMLDRFPGRVGVLKSLTTRPKRDHDEDDLFYDFVSVEEMRRKEADGELIQISEYAGNLYGNDLMSAAELLKSKIGISALVEQGVKNLQNAGFNIVVVKVIPQDWTFFENEERRAADEARAKEGLKADFEIVNSFAPGGLDQAVEDLAGVIEMLS